MISRPARALAVAVLLALAGCTGTLVDIGASPATIPASAYEPAGYVHGNTTEVPLTYPVGVAGLRRDVTVRAWVSGYSKTSAENDTVGLLVVSSPDIEVAGLSLNPLGQLSNRELAGFLLERVDQVQGIAGVENVSDVTEVGVRNRTVLGERTEVVTYAATVRTEGNETSVLFHVAAVRHGDDVVAAIGVHDADVDEGDTLVALVEHIEHEAAPAEA